VHNAIEKKLGYSTAATAPAEHRKLVNIVVYQYN
jgi:hypothetical protein